MSVFDQHAERYDAWYDTPRGRAAFESETACLAALLGRLPRPWLEVGVGTGRFAQALGAGEGVDPALGALRMARRRMCAWSPVRGSGCPTGRARSAGC